MRTKRQFGDVFDRKSYVPLGPNERVTGYFCNNSESAGGDATQFGVFTTLFGPTFAVVDDLAALSEEDLEVVDEFMKSVAERQKDQLRAFIGQSVTIADELKNAGFADAGSFVDGLRERAQEKVTAERSS